MLFAIRAVKARSAFNINLNGNYFKESALEKIQSLLEGKEVGGKFSLLYFDFDKQCDSC